MAVDRPVKDEVVYHLVQALKGVAWAEAPKVYQGWSDDDLDNDTGGDMDVPCIILDAGQVSRTPTSGEFVERSDDAEAGLGADEVAVYWRRAQIEFPIRLTVYAASKTRRGELQEPIRKLFYPPAVDKTSGPMPPGLMLSLDQHGDVNARVLMGSDDDDDRESVEAGLYRADYDLQAYAPEVVRTVYDKATYQNTVET